MARYKINVDLAEPTDLKEWADYIEERNLVSVDINDDKTEATFTGSEDNVRAALVDYCGGDAEDAAFHFNTYAERLED